MPNIAATENILLWGGWSIQLPLALANSARNEDGSWSGWGEDWVVDVQIVEFSPKNLVVTSSVERSLESGGKKIAGPGWVGAVETLVENDNGRDVFRLAGTMTAPGTFLSCWVSYFRADQYDMALSFVQSVAHSNAT